MELLPATTFQAPPRRRLNTIIEENTIHGRQSDSGDDSDRTIIGPFKSTQARPPYEMQSREKSSRLAVRQERPTWGTSPCSSAGDGLSVQHSSQPSRPSSLRHSYTDSDAGTVFSEDDRCPSLTGSHASEPTTFYTESSRNSVASTRSGRRQFPSILIPRDSWQEMNGPVKEMDLEMSPAKMIMLSPQALSQLNYRTPAPEGPPSLADASSSASLSPCIPALSSVPPTPDLDNLEPNDGQAWGTPHQTPVSIEIALDEHESILISPQELRSAHSSIHSAGGYATDWSDMMVRFPAIPGATPIDYTPISPNFDRLRAFDNALENMQGDRGVQLPTDAMQLLTSLTQKYSVDEELSPRSRAEMVEKPVSLARQMYEQEPNSAAAGTEYSFSQLSIPSPGGFFSSLKGGARQTWCTSKDPSAPTSAIAENFYNNATWENKSSRITERVIDLPETASGPTTAIRDTFKTPRLSRFESYVTDTDASSETVTATNQDDEDLYGPAPVDTFDAAPTTVEPRYEYEETYEAELRQAAEVNIDRTSDWLSAQDSYLSALRETNPLNDPADFPMTPHPQDDEDEQRASTQLETEKAVQFLKEATRTVEGPVPKTYEPKVSSPKEELFLAAFTHHHGQAKQRDAFLQSAPRLDQINSERLALPLVHIQTLLNILNSSSIASVERPKYRGPFQENPRATGSHSKTPEQLLFAEAERKQRSMERVRSGVWSIEALSKTLYSDRLLACADMAKRLDATADELLASGETSAKKQFRILDLAGAATASWAWAAAVQWPQAKIYTVQTRAQTEVATKLGLNKSAAKDVLRPANPINHRVITAPTYWSLPFADNYFDVISTRTLHMFIKSKPIPGMASIDEWDLTLKECMRVLKPGGMLDFFILDPTISSENIKHKRKGSRASTLYSIDSNITSISPSQTVGQHATTNFGSSAAVRSAIVLDSFTAELQRCGYESDGGCGKLVSRLKKTGFAQIKRQWVGLPMGRAGPTHTDPACIEDGRASVTNRLDANCLKSPMVSSFTQASVAKTRASAAPSSVNSSYSWYFESDGTRRKTAFPPAPRPLSEVSTVSQIVSQYSNVEAVQGPVGSTAEVADMAGLLGSTMWEEWLVRTRINMGVTDPSKLLDGVSDVFYEGWMQGACWKGLVGWAQKPRSSLDAKKLKNQRRATSAHAVTEEDAGRIAGIKQKLQLNLTLDTKNVRTGPRTAPLPLPVISENPTEDKGSDQKTFNAGPVVSPDTKQGKLNSARSNSACKTPNSLESYYPMSAIERGEIGTIPMMIIE